MLIKALTYNKKVLQDNFEPYIIDIVKEVMQIAKNLLDEIPPDSNEVKFVTYANFLTAISFEVHPSTRKEKHSIEF
jgi:hypothetical protein